jgi:hypothetical protein
LTALPNQILVAGVCCGPTPVINFNAARLRGITVFMAPLG